MQPRYATTCRTDPQRSPACPNRHSVQSPNATCHPHRIDLPFWIRISNPRRQEVTVRRSRFVQIGAGTTSMGIACAKLGNVRVDEPTPLAKCSSNAAPLVGTLHHRVGRNQHELERVDPHREPTDNTPNKTRLASASNAVVCGQMRDEHPHQRVPTQAASPTNEAAATSRQVRNASSRQRR